MSSIRFRSPIVPRTPLLRFLALALLSLAPRVAEGGPETTGQWSPSADWSDGHSDNHAVHLMLVRGDGNPYRARIVWWYANLPSGFFGGEWGWRAGNEGCDAFPTASFDSLPLAPPAGVDILCSSNSGLADGRVLLAGGTFPTTGFYGENKTTIFTPGSGEGAGTWSSAGEMAEWRWYPVSVPLREGSRTLVLSGAQHRRHRVFGGRRNGVLPSGSQADSLYRFAPLVGGQWERAVIPDADPDDGRPLPRELHTTVGMEYVSGFAGQVLFGGWDSTQAQVYDDTWSLQRLTNLEGSDWGYRWLELHPATLPGRRAEHSAVLALDNSMLIFGGRDSAYSANSQLWRLHVQQNQPTWTQVIPDPGDNPGARYGHAAIWGRDTSGTSAVNHMLVFGGRSAPGQPPSDLAVWEFRLTNPTQGFWLRPELLDLGFGAPAPRVGHRMERDSLWRTATVSGQPKRGRVTYLFGGKLANGAYSDTLWLLWYFTDGKVGWERRAVAGASPPSGRAGHSLVLDHTQGGVYSPGRLYIFGGANASGPADNYVYVADPWKASPTWERWAEAGANLTGHTSVLDLEQNVARTAEIYTPGSGWAADPSAHLLQPLYPPTFLIPRGGTDSSRVLSLSHTGVRAHWIDLPSNGSPSGGWKSKTSLNVGFRALTGVPYRPDRILLAGGTAQPPQTGVVGTAKKLNALDLNTGWTATGSMKPRYHHNLVVLPDGTVLAVGGQLNPGGFPSGAVRRPEIWNPDGNGGVGEWTGDTLALQPLSRGYHSTAVLLPDGRVLSAGGEYPGDMNKAELFCPPYLYRSDGQLAERPIINRTATTMTWKQPFTICVPTEDSLTRAVLLRPGMTTHSFDENQRYVPLTRVTKADNPPRLLVTAPASPDSAPPGDYLLFLTGSKDGTDVPSIAKWVRLGNTAGVDSCDVVDPGEVSPSPELISQDRIYFEWTASADDGTLGASGRSKVYRVRRSASPIHSEGTWSTATISSLGQGEDIPDTVGTAEAGTVASLQSCTTYYFALRAEDDNGNLSAIHDTVKAKTLCPGGGGGGDPGGAGRDVTMAGAAGGRDGFGGGFSRAQVAAPTSAALVIESQRKDEGWRILMSSPSQFDGVDANRVLLQSRDATGTWETKNAITPREEDLRLGVCAPRGEGRRVFPGNFELQAVAPSLRGRGGPLALKTAVHSRLGDLAALIWSGVGSVALAAGETIELVYEQKALATPPEEDWFVLLQRNPNASSPSREAVAQEPDLPQQFALYQNRPNPFSNTTSIRFDLPKPTSVRLTIYDIAGRKVRTLTSSDWPAGRHNLEWNHRSDAGVRLGSGAYISRLIAGEYRAERKMILLR